MNANPKFLPTVAGAGGKGGGSGSGGGVEAPNNLRSKQLARLIDLISEGPIMGMERGLQDCYLDGVPVQNPDGSYNFSSFEAQIAGGWPDQDFLPGFAAQQAETTVGLQIKASSPPVVRTINNPDVNRVRITVSVPALQIANKNTGDVVGAEVTFQIQIQVAGGGWQVYAELQIAGKTNTRYQRSYVFPVFGTPQDIRLVRITPDSTTAELQNDFYWDSYTEIIDARVNYTLSAVFGWTIDSEQFQSIPKRVYRIMGIAFLIPNNYDPFTRAYTGVWDGGWAFNWSNNPAWVLYDLITNNRYGIGDFIGHNDVDKWAFYRIAQFCDGWVPNGKGGWEPRFTCNAVINNQQEAFDLLQSMASVFRGFSYWAGGLLVPVADMPADPVGLYTNSNVIDGSFTYSGADIRARHTQVLVSWNDPSNLGEARIAIVEDPDAVSRYGIVKTELVAIGCTSEAQAIRTGRWTLYTEAYETETVTFSTGLEGAWCRPGDIIQVSDHTVSGENHGGRVVSATTTQIVADRPVDVTGVSHTLSVLMPDGRVETRGVYPNGTTLLTVIEPFSSAPLPDSTWVVSSNTAEATLWRVTSVTENGDNTYQITGLQHRPDKWSYVENNIPLSEPDVSNIGPAAVTNLTASDYLVALSPISVGVRMLISWTSIAPAFEVAYRYGNGNWIRVRTEQTALDVEAFDGQYEIRVTPLNSLGARGQAATIYYTVVGLSAPPADPRNFRIQIINGVAMFQWAPATDLDVIIGGSFEMRYSPRTTGASWSSSNTIVTSIPGTATTVELPYRAGTYLLRTRDITGLFSVNAAIVIAVDPDTSWRNFTRICEHPDFLGEKLNTEVRMPQEWLVIGTTGGLWDDQTALMDTWPDVDVLPDGPAGPSPPAGSYWFEKHIDMGGVFPVHLMRDVLAFPFFEDADQFIDARPGLVDDWQDWDNMSQDAAGMVNILVRQTNDDPLDPAAQWTNWAPFIAGNFTGRGFEFRADLTAPVGQNMAIEEMCIIADISAKVDQQADRTWVGPKMHIPYQVKFFSVPSLSIAIQQGIENDTFRITNKTRDGFDLELLTSGGSPITGARTFDWIASGY